MPNLVIYYSHDGHTKRLAHAIAEKLGAELAEITAERYRSKIIGYLRAAFDSLRGHMPAIDHPPIDLEKFDAIAIGAPIWTSYLATPVRAFLTQNGEISGRLGVFVTSGSPSRPEAAFRMAAGLLGRKPDAELAVGNQKEDSEETRRHVDGFVAALRGP